MKTFRRFGAILMLMMLVVLIPVQGVLAKTTKAKDTPLKDVRKAVEAEGQWETNSKWCGVSDFKQRLESATPHHQHRPLQRGRWHRQKDKNRSPSAKNQIR